MSTRPRIVLDSVLRALRPLVQLLVRNGVTYPAFAAALKRVFLDAAREELQRRSMQQTDSAVTLLSGVHRRDVRNLTRAAAPRAAATHEPLSLAAQVVARWISEPACLHDDGQPKPLPRAEFDALVARVSSDVRPRAMLDELLRLGAVTEADDSVVLTAHGFAPRRGFDELARLTTANLHDHLQAAALNLDGQANFLEQAVFVDEISTESAARLQAVSTKVWQQAMRQVMREAQDRFDADALGPADQRRHRARFGVYFYSERENEQ